jgi:hypothetical protein
MGAFIELILSRSEIDHLSYELEAKTTCNVVVFQSGNPEFFIAHADVDLISNLAQSQ